MSAKKVFVYSDPEVGKKHGYTFDGQAEDDEFGTLYLYTGAGTEGHQQLAGGNKSLLEAGQMGREVHLFVAAGKVLKKKEKYQRYVGQVVIDPVLPYEERMAPDRNGAMRRVFVFRLRPAPGATLHLTDADAVKPATKNTVVEVPTLPEPVKLPAQTSAKDKKTENHATDETTSNVAGGARKVIRREGQLTKAFQAHLTAAGHTHKSFQITVAGERGTLTPDIYDVTDNVLYEAKGLSTRAHVRMAIGQLLDYRRHINVPPGLRLAVLLPSKPTADIQALLDRENIALVTQKEGGFEGFPLPPSSN
ncbi:hypothetical protein [Streptomyces avicenniae]|uniref:hypothetical protein n=1 Tax=Streptomyces avicenniae TaxID=500153 RepID=UPI000AEC8209|nr:hypothetical protein [Streptomyces avicenniae]